MTLRFDDAVLLASTMAAVNDTDCYVAVKPVLLEACNLLFQQFLQVESIWLQSVHVAVCNCDPPRGQMSMWAGTEKAGGWDLVASGVGGDD